MIDANLEKHYPITQHFYHYNKKINSSFLLEFIFYYIETTMKFVDYVTYSKNN